VRAAGYLVDGAVSGDCDVADVRSPPDAGFAGAGCGAWVRVGAGPLMTSKSKLVRPMGTSCNWEAAS
jgi:hypothetical protein